MNSADTPTKPRGLAAILSWRRLRYTLLISIACGFVLPEGWRHGHVPVVTRAIVVGLVDLLLFGLFEQWPRRLPRWLARWVLQVVAVGLAALFTSAAIFLLTTAPGTPPFYLVTQRMNSCIHLAMLGLLVGPWAALAALLRQKDAFAREQALAFELDRSQLERQAADARLRLLQAQVAPHFLFNTLANVQALVDAGSPQARVVLRSLVAYLRAAVPRLNEPSTTLGQELELVKAYLELMHMRMPDRLQFTLRVDDSTRDLRCPPMTLLTLVENAVRHGIDPSEEGGRIDIEVRRHGARCEVRVRDTGAGLGTPNGGLGTGLSTLRERLHLTFGGDAELRVAANAPVGVSAELEFPAREGVN